MQSGLLAVAVAEHRTAALALQRALQWGLLQELLFLVEKRRHGVQHRARPIYAAAAVVKVVMECSTSMAISRCYDTFGAISMSQSTIKHVSSLAALISDHGELRRLSMVPRELHGSLSVEQLLLTHVAAQKLHAGMVQQQVASDIQPASPPLQHVVYPAPTPPTAPLKVQPPCEAPPPPPPPTLASWPGKVQLDLLQFLSSASSQPVPPTFIGVETAGAVFNAARDIATGISHGLYRATRVAKATAYVLWGDPTARSVLHSFEDLVPGGVQWKRKEKKLRVDLQWLHTPPDDENSGRRAPPAMYWHDRPEPIFAFHYAERQLVLDLVAANNFIGLFPPDSPERVATAKWEAAAAVGTAEALLEVRLNENFTLLQALQEGVKGYDNRHGTMHVKWQVHAHNRVHQAYLDDGRYQPRRSSSGHALSPRRALFTLVEDFIPFATKLYNLTIQALPPSEQLVPSHPDGRILADHPFSYASTSLYGDASLVGNLKLEALLQLCNTKAGMGMTEGNLHSNGDSKGMDLHRDKNSGTSVVMVLSEERMEGFQQLYPANGIGLPLKCWSWSCSNSRDLLHAVARGRGLRIAFIFTVHTAIATGVTDNAQKRELAWDVGVKEAQASGLLDRVPYRLQHLLEKDEAEAKMEEGGE